MLLLLIQKLVTFFRILYILPDFLTCINKSDDDDDDDADDDADDGDDDDDDDILTI